MKKGKRNTSKSQSNDNTDVNFMFNPMPRYDDNNEVGGDDN